MYNLLREKLCVEPFYNQTNYSSLSQAKIYLHDSFNLCKFKTTVVLHLPYYPLVQYCNVICR